MEDPYELIEIEAPKAQAWPEISAEASDLEAGIACKYVYVNNIMLNAIYYNNNNNKNNKNDNNISNKSTASSLWLLKAWNSAGDPSCSRLPARRGPVGGAHSTGARCRADRQRHHMAFQGVAIMAAELLFQAPTAGDAGWVP